MMEIWKKIRNLMEISSVEHIHSKKIYNLHFVESIEVHDLVMIESDPIQIDLQTM
jgi:hypothetical protein